MSEDKTLLVGVLLLSASTAFGCLVTAIIAAFMPFSLGSLSMFLVGVWGCVYLVRIAWPRRSKIAEILRGE